MAHSPLTEDKETPSDEGMESTTEQQQELDLGMERQPVPVTEEFQAIVAELLKDASTSELAFLEHSLSARKEELQSGVEPTMDDFQNAKLQD